MAASPSWPSSSMSDDDGPSSSFTAPVVLLKGPGPSDEAGLYPQLARHISTVLASPPSDPPSSSFLEVLNGAEVIRATKDLSAYAEPTLVSFDKRQGKPGLREWKDWRLNMYRTKRKVARGRAPHWRDIWYEDWETIEIPELECTRPPAAPLDLFTGLRAYFCQDLIYKAGANPDSYPARSRVLQQSLIDVFTAFGGTVMSKPTHETTHCFSSDCERQGQLSDVMRDKMLILHPHWICLSVELGALAPTSVFELKLRHPVTAFTASDNYSYYGSHYKNAFLPSLNDTHSGHDEEGVAPSMFTVVGLVVGGHEPPGAPLSPSLIGRRLFFDCSATPAGRKGAPPQLAAAVAAFVGRSEARVVDDARTADWLVVSERSGPTYWHGLSNPSKIMGTLQHLLAHFDRVDEEPIDPRSSLLYFPLPATTTKTAARLPDAAFFISPSYPEDYRLYLAGLAEALDQRQRPLEESPTHLRSKSPITIAPSTDNAHRVGPHLLPRFLEDSFLHLDGPSIFDLEEEVFLQEELECFSPSKLPKNFARAEFRPERLDDEAFAKLNDIEERWQHYSSTVQPQTYYDTKRICECNSCRVLPQ